jgi:hypothetical protein
LLPCVELFDTRAGQGHEREHKPLILQAWYKFCKKRLCPLKIKSMSSGCALRDAGSESQLSNLQDRVHDYLRNSNENFVEDVPRSVAIEDMLKSLRAAEESLRVAQARVDKIKADIAKLES